MQNEIYTLYHCRNEPAQFDALQALVAEIVEATKWEPNTLTYEFVVHADRTTVHIIERYRSNGLLPHVTQTFAPYAERFLKLAKVDRLYVYGETTPEMRETLDEFGAVYLTPLAGFSR